MKKFEEHYLDATDNGTHYIPSGDFILKNCKHEFDKNGVLVKLTIQKNMIFVFYGRKIIIKVGFEFDGVSTGIFKLFFPKFNKQTLSAGLLHDWLYSKYYFIDRHIADVYLKIVLICSKVGIIKSNSFYVAVRLFGWMPWRKNKKQ